ncbi:MAG: hypothetical protein WBV55_01215 [Candidatus Sulfotelmatobacter sp.]
MTDSIDLDAVEKKIKEEYVRACEALQTLKKYLGNGANGSGSRVAPIAIDRMHEVKPDSGDFVDVVEGDPQTIIDRVEQIMLSDTHKKWSVPLMVAHLKNINFPLRAKTPEATMGLVFGKLLRKRRTIFRVRRGSGRMPSLYRGIPREHQEDASESDTQNERATS